MYRKLNYIFSGKDRFKIALLLFMVIIGSMLELMGVAIFSPFVDIVMDAEKIDQNPYLSYFYGILGCDDSKEFLAVLAGCIIFIYIFKNIFLWLEQDCILKFSYNMQKKISARLLRSYLYEPYVFHLNKNVAELQRSLQEDTGLFSQMLVHTMQLIAEIVVCIVLGVFLFITSKSITIIVLGVLVCCVGVFVSVTRKFSKSLGKQGQVYKAKIYQWINQSMGGVKEVKVLGREEYFVKNYQKYYSLYVKIIRLNKLISITPKYIVEAACMTGLLAAIIGKMFWGQREDITAFIPQIAVFAVAGFKLMPSVGKINEHISNILFAVPSIELIYQDLKEIENFKECAADEQKDWRFENGIIAKGISYAYPNTDKLILDSAVCSIPKGKTVAFIGGSGAGKTTMVDIILGLLTPQMGKVMADDINIFKNLSSWHKQIGYIPQTIYLSDESIRNNVAFGIEEEEINDAAVENAIRKAQLSDFIENLPDGLDTVAGDRGVRLSGGQRQRIGIARALYHDPEILVLDEATSALDHETETAVMESIESLQGMKTIIIIAHRLTTIRNADVIYEVGEGKVIERKKQDVFQEA